jgi:hypothetical protein
LSKETPRFKYRLAEGNSLIIVFLIILLFIVFTLPEGFDQRDSFGVIWIGEYSVSLADILSGVILFFGLISMLFYRSIIYSHFMKPLLILTSILIFQTIRVINLYEFRDILKDFRPIIEWLCIIAFPQFIRSVNFKRKWVRWGIFVIVVPPVLVSFYTLIRYLFFGPFTTFGYLSDRIQYVNGASLLPLAMAGAYFIINPGRKYKIIFWLISFLYFLQFILSESRSYLIGLILVYVMLFFMSCIRHKTIKYMFTTITGLVIAITMSLLIMSPKVSSAINRFSMYLNITSFTSGHDLPRIEAMKVEFYDFLRNPILGVGLGKPYLAQYGIYKGQKLTSPSDSAFIDISAKTGILGIFSFIWIFVIYWRLLKKLFKEELYRELSSIEQSFIWGSFITFPIIIMWCIFSNVLWAYRTPPLEFVVNLSVVETIFYLQRYYTRRNV